MYGYSDFPFCWWFSRLCLTLYILKLVKLLERVRVFLHVLFTCVLPWCNWCGWLGISENCWFVVTHNILLLNTNNSMLFDFFLAISVVSLFEVDDDTYDLVSVGWEKNDSMFCCTILMELELEWRWSGKMYSAKLIYPNRNGMVQFLAVCFHALGPVHWKRGKGVLAYAV